MRKGLLIMGITLIVLAVVVFFVGIYLSSGLTTSVTSLVTSPRNETTLKPGSSINVGTASADETLIVMYNDTLDQPLQVSTTSPGALTVETIEGQYVIIYAPETGAGSLYLVNNYSQYATVYYSYGVINVSSALPLFVSLVASIGIGLAGVVLAILGAVLRESGRSR